MKDLIYRQDAIDLLDVLCQEHRYKIPGKWETYSQYNEAWQDALDRAESAIGNLPSAQPEKEKAKRVLWTGWKGTRNTRYKCPNCKKPVKNDDIYCHRCGQKLMFPHVSWTPYVEGQKQELIVRWDDE